MVDRIVASEDAHVLILEPMDSDLICEYMTLPGNRDFADVIKLRNLR